MDDKLIMDNILTSTKSVCDLMMHGTIESSTTDVHSAFAEVLNDSLCMQNEIYKKMSQKGWYPSEQAEKQRSMLQSRSLLRTDKNGYQNLKRIGITLSSRSVFYLINFSLATQQYIDGRRERAPSVVP